jgi:cell division protein FtsI (penicillin-binding protein 3)
MVLLEIAPREVGEPAALKHALTRLSVDPTVIARALDTSVAWLRIPGRFLAVDAARAMSIRGVHATSAVERSYSSSQGAGHLVGTVDADDRAVDGLELALDSVLRGTPGRATMLLDSKGQLRESPTVPGTAPVPGNSVVLTINSDLQEIAENALADAVSRMGAEGGDIVILDPHTGELLALASRRGGADAGQRAATAITEPFEPGSTLKPFIAAGLLERGRVHEADSVDTGNGVLEINGRQIHDEHHLGRAPLAEVLRWSSNIGIVKFAQRLTAREEFETLRDFGFGTATGVAYPTESPGTLRPPRTWSLQSANSMAMGYEIAVTPLQLALAYAAFANGGRLLEPALVKAIVGPNGTVKYTHTPRVVRQVISAPVADTVRRMLLGVVDEGTALQAAIENYLLAGKTGTPRSTVGGHYVAGRYNPNFVGLFPGDAPQYVIVVKLTAPHGTFYGGTTAAPLSKAVLQAAIAARDAALDREKLVLSSRRAVRSDGGSAAPEGSPPSAENRELAPQRIPYVVTLPFRGESERVAEPPRRVPDVRGLPVRDAVRSLHNAGFHVQLVHGAAPGTSPASGEIAAPGALVRLHVDY